jgi:hypothetical protein
MPRYTAKRPAPRRCATCAFCKTRRHDSVCTAPVPAWVAQIEREYAADQPATALPLNEVDVENHEDPKCPTWAPRGPTTH